MAIHARAAAAVLVGLAAMALGACSQPASTTSPGAEPDESPTITVAPSVVDGEPLLRISSDGVGNGDHVVVVGTGFAPGSVLALAPCAGDILDGKEMDEVCDMSVSEVVKVDSDGLFATSIQLWTVIAAGSRIERNCLVDACSLGAGAMAHLVDAAVPINWAPDATTTAAPVITISALSLDVESNTGSAVLHGSGFAPLSVVELAQCPIAQSGNGVDGAHCLYTYGLSASTDADGEFDVTMTVYPRFQRSDNSLIDCTTSPGLCGIAAPWPIDPGARMSWVAFDTVRLT